jgi:adenylate cyclase
VGVEIERKFLVAEDPGDEGETTVLRQAYLAIDGDRAVRVRQAGDTWILTIKAGKGISRTEVELPLDEATFEELWAVAGDRAVAKARTRLPLPGGLVAELDTFSGRHQGLRLVEVEVPSTADAERFEPPGWFGEDVSDQPWAANSWLSDHDLPDHLR